MILERAHLEVSNIAESLIEKHHPFLDTAEVTIDFLFALPELDKNGEPKGPALMHQGYEALGTCRITSYKDRVKGMKDAEIILDKPYWDNASTTEREALIDHEITHLELKLDKDGDPEHDDLGRPKLQLRKHDRQFGWFDEVAERHGRASAEVKQAASLIQTGRQLYFAGFEVEAALAKD